jgi:2-C-methyl-D-erythritol 4-phosphate cytidylyltransferase
MAALHLIVPAAGSGSRLGRPEPKALVPICGRPLIAWTLESLRPIEFSRTVVAAPPERVPEFQALLGGVGCVVAGGETRAASVRAAFFALRADRDDVVCIHDAARPFVTATEASAVAARARERGAAIAAMPIVDTVKKIEGDRILGTLDRTGLYAAGTPQAFRVGVLADALATGREATDEAGLCEMLGIRVSIVPVSRLAFKVTTPEDLLLAEAVLASRR